MKRTSAKQSSQQNPYGIVNDILTALAKSEDNDFYDLPIALRRILIDRCPNTDTDLLSSATYTFASKLVTEKLCSGSHDLFETYVQIFYTDPTLIYKKIFAAILEDTPSPFSPYQIQKLITLCPNGRLLRYAIAHLAEPVAQSLVVYAGISFKTLASLYYNDPECFYTLTAHATYHDTMHNSVAAYDIRQLFSQYGFTLKQFRNVYKLFTANAPAFSSVESFAAPHLGELIKICNVSASSISTLSTDDIRACFASQAAQEAVKHYSFSPWEVIVLSLKDKKMAQTLCEHHNAIAPFLLHQIIPIYHLNPGIVQTMQYNPRIDNEISYALQCISPKQWAEMLTTPVQRLIIEHHMPLLHVALCYNEDPEALQELAQHIDSNPCQHAAHILGFYEIWEPVIATLKKYVLFHKENTAIISELLAPATQAIMRQFQGHISLTEWVAIRTSKTPQEFSDYITNLTSPTHSPASSSGYQTPEDDRDINTLIDLWGNEAGVAFTGNPPMIQVFLKPETQTIIQHYQQETMSATKWQQWVEIYHRDGHDMFQTHLAKCQEKMPLLAFPSPRKTEASKSSSNDQPPPDWEIKLLNSRSSSSSKQAYHNQ